MPSPVSASANLAALLRMLPPVANPPNVKQKRVRRGLVARYTPSTVGIGAVSCQGPREARSGQLHAPWCGDERSHTGHVKRAQGSCMSSGVARALTHAAKKYHCDCEVSTAPSWCWAGRSRRGTRRRRARTSRLAGSGRPQAWPQVCWPRARSAAATRSPWIWRPQSLKTPGR